MRPIIHFAAAVSVVLLATLPLRVRADEVSDKGRDVFEKNRHAVVTVEVVQKVTVPGRTSNQRESKADLTGTVIDPSGLAVLALSACDPAELYRRMSDDYKAEVEITDMKILLEDGTELPAEIVLRDKDLDLAFIRPKTKPASPMAAVDLSKSAPARILDQIITLNRLKQAAGRAFCASVERISAVVQKPRTFYIPDSSMSETGLGSPAFSLNGSVLGLFVMRAVNAQNSGNVRDSMASIILPAEDVLKAATQAPAEVKPDEDKKESPKDTAPDTNKSAPKTDSPKEPAK